MMIYGGQRSPQTIIMMYACRLAVACASAATGDLEVIQMSDDVNQQLVLRARPTGVVTDDSFELVEQPVAAPASGQVLVRTLWLSFEPAQRGWLNDVRSYVPPVAIGEVMRSWGVGQVIASGHPDFEPGQFVHGTLHWQTHALLDLTADDQPAERTGSDPCRGRRPEVDAQRRRRDRDDGVLRDALRRSARRRRHRARHRRRRSHGFRRRPGRPQPRRCSRDRHGRVDGQARVGARRRRLRRVCRPLRRQRPPAAPRTGSGWLQRRVRQRGRGVARRGAVQHRPTRSTRPVRVDLHRLSPGEAGGRAALLPTADDPTGAHGGLLALRLRGPLRRGETHAARLVHRRQPARRARHPRGPRERSRWASVGCSTAATSASRSCTSPTPYECVRHESAASGTCAAISATSDGDAVADRSGHVRRRNSAAPGDTARRRSSGARAARLQCRRCIDRSSALVHPRPGVLHPPVAARRQHRSHRGHHDGHQVTAERVGRATPTHGQHRRLESRRHVCARSRTRTSRPRPSGHLAGQPVSHGRGRQDLGDTRCGSASSTSTTPTSTSTGSPNKHDRS